jgi:hypothetical protein
VLDLQDRSVKVQLPQARSRHQPLAL